MTLDLHSIMDLMNYFGKAVHKIWKSSLKPILETQK